MGRSLSWTAWCMEDSEEGGRVSPAIRIGILLGAAIVPYLNSLSGPFIFDAGALVIDDARIHHVDADNVRRILTENYWSGRFDSGLFRPISTLSYMLNYAWGREVPTGYHVVNILLHATAVLLVYASILTVSQPAAFWSALIWAVHPLNTEVVTSIAGRPDLIATVCVLGGWLLYQRRYRWSLLAVMTVGMFAKETAAVLLGVVLLHDWWLRRRPDWLAVGAVTLPIAAYAVVHQMLGLSMSRPFVDNPEVAAGWFAGRLTAVTVAWKLVTLWIWPVRLSADYSYAQIPVTAAWESWVLAAMLTAVVAWAVWQRRFWVLFVAGCMLPTSNLLVQIGSVMAERFMYLPGIGLAVCVVLLVSTVPRPIAVRVGTVAVLALTLRTWDRNQDWGDELRFWRETAAVSPASFKARSSLALELFERGDKVGASREADATMGILASLPAERDALLPYLEAQQFYTATGENGKARAAAQRAADILNATGATPGNRDKSRQIETNRDIK